MNALAIVPSQYPRGQRGGLARRHQLQRVHTHPSDVHVRRNEVGAAAHAVRSELFRHRIDWHWLNNGMIEAVLTVTLPDGHEFRFRAQADPHEIAEALAAQHPQIGGFLGKMWKGIKKVAKTVATSKVFKMAAGAMALIAPALGPLAPMALGAGAALKATTALIAARSHQAKGNTAAAAQLVEYAAKASKVAAVASPPKSSRKAANPSAAAHQTHMDASRAASGKLFQLLLKPA
jgi:hypothetical protein